VSQNAIFLVVFELVVDNRSEKKGKGIAFTENTADDEALEESVEDENLSENLVMLFQ